jgi:gamma-D-glutamyl-L-lysine dipeptidyl-peptidase
MDQEYGICRLSVIPVRQTDSDKSEMVTQLLFGEHYTVLGTSQNRQWVKIQNYFDGYEGWLSSNQHHQISPEYFEQVNNSDYKIALDISTIILFKNHHIQILMGSILPISTHELFRMEEKLAFNGDSKSLGQKWDYEQLKVVASKYLNAPYLWGGKSPFGIDCSGFTQMVFRICGYRLKRDTSEQVKQGIVIEKLGDALPGDLIFCSNSISGASHVGILLENGQVIHASGKVRIDTLTEASITNAENGKLTHVLTGIRRILKSTR